jgi:putative addiction module component (TIGR02574 family)
MAETLEHLKQELGTLTAQERAELAHFLISSLDEEADPEAEAAWEAELARRVSEIKSGKVSGKPAAQVFGELRQTFP